MAIINLAGLAVSESAYRRARQITEENPRRTTADEVLSSLREMMPGWTITTSASQWGEGARNIEISRRTLERMAEDPEVLIRYKALILDLDDAVPMLEEWKRENPGRYFEFGLMFDAETNTTQGMALVRTLIGGENRAVFDLPNERPLWAELIQQKLDSLAAGEEEAPEGGRSWIA